MGNSPRELEYQEKVVREILRETSGENLDVIMENQGTRDTLTLLLVKGGNVPGKAVFGASGGFTPTLCHNLQTVRMSRETAAVAREIKRKYVGRGKLVDDGGEGEWGCPLIDQGHLSWIENETLYDPNDSESVEDLVRLQEETNREVFERGKLSFPKTSILFVAASRGRPPHELMVPHLSSDYTVWQRKIKRAFDPNCASDPSTYLEP